LMPWPGCSVVINGQIVKLGLADSLPSPDDTHAVGEVLGNDVEGLQVKTGRDLVRLRLLQRPGGRMLPAAEFLRGWPVAVGTKLPSQSMLPLVGRTPFPRPKV
jgi:methionyl-tRNA formyltransferase